MRSQSNCYVYQVMANLMSSTKNEIFVHYIFMDNKFVLPTASGLPLTFALSGTFTPGAKGGLNFAPKQVLMVIQISFCQHITILKS